MPEIQLSIVVPLSTSQHGSMTADDIAQAVEAGSNTKPLEAKLDRIKSTVNAFGRSLELILEEVDGSIERAKALRELAKDAKEWTG